MSVHIYEEALGGFKNALTQRSVLNSKKVEIIMDEVHYIAFLFRNTVTVVPYGTGKRLFEQMVVPFSDSEDPIIKTHQRLIGFGLSQNIIVLLKRNKRMGVF